MRDKNAVYGDEMSAHHYCRDFVHCDSGMIPWFLVAEMVSRHGPLADLVAHRKVAFPSSGEINFTLADPKAAIVQVRASIEPEAITIDEMDGLGLDIGEWRFNLRSSNTEPVVRLNVEARGDTELVALGVERDVLGRDGNLQLVAARTLKELVDGPSDHHRNARK